jgi:hypothetical protein
MENDPTLADLLLWAVEGIALGLLLSIAIVLL